MSSFSVGYIGTDYMLLVCLWSWMFFRTGKAKALRRSTFDLVTLVGDRINWSLLIPSSSMFL